MLAPEKSTRGVQMKRRQSYRLPTIVFDCDDVLLNWQEGFCAWMRTVYRRNLDPCGQLSWDLDDWIGESARPFIEKFNASAIFGSLVPVAGAREAVAKFYAAGHELHVVTACSDDPAIVGRRLSNLDRVFGDVFASITCVPLGFSKAEALDAIRSNTSQEVVWIEDNYKNAILGIEQGFHCWMMRRNHNRADEPLGDPRIRWTDDFERILQSHLHREVIAA